MKENHTGHHRLLAICSFLFLFLMFTGPGLCHALEIEIDVSPNTLNLSSQGHVCTIHTDIDFDLVEVSTVYLNGIAIDSWKADDRGNFVAKFIIDEVKDLPLDIDEYNTLKLVGLTTDDVAFWGEQEIMVINVVPNGGRQ